MDFPASDESGIPGNAGGLPNGNRPVRACPDDIRGLPRKGFTGIAKVGDRHGRRARGGRGA